MNVTESQIVIAGGGITGLTIARELLRRGAQDITILEKEGSLGEHASGRNSGILHAGIYYTPDTLKARFCIKGNRLMKDFVREKGLTLKENGKVIVTKDESELPRLYELKRRADAAGAQANLIDRKELIEREPHATTFEQAIYSPETAVIRPKEILAALAAHLEASGLVHIVKGTQVLGVGDSNILKTSNGSIRFESLINAAGAHADRIAHAFGLGKEYRILPFKGTYKKLVPTRAFLVHGSIYPVPDLEKPFLGVHFTRGVDDAVHVGPTAIPAFGRENYQWLRGSGRELAPILYRDAVLFFRDRSFRQAAFAETRKYSRRVVFKEARQLVPDLREEDIERSSKVGIRPQLIHWPTKKLVMDFVVIRDGDTMHILNAISPAFTSSMAFAQSAVDKLLGTRSHSDAV